LPSPSGTPSGGRRVSERTDGSKTFPLDAVEILRPAVELATVAAVGLGLWLRAHKFAQRI